MSDQDVTFNTLVKVLLEADSYEWGCAMAVYWRSKERDGFTPAEQECLERAIAEANKDGDLTGYVGLE